VPATALPLVNSSTSCKLRFRVWLPVPVMLAISKPLTKFPALAVVLKSNAVVVASARVSPSRRWTTP
jgi:hypothetical protein